MAPKKLILFALIAVFAIASCGKKSSPGPATVKSAPVVYVTGNCYSAADGQSLAVYWKNGIKVALADSTGINISATSGIAINDTDVYIAGAVNFKATYWKNGKPVTLANGYYAYAITVNGNDVYVAGSTPYGQPVYWKNGVLVSLPINQPCLADGIAVQGNDVYVTSSTDSAGFLKVIYWKNGVLTTLGSSTSYIGNYYQNIYSGGRVNIAVNSSNVYIIGAPSTGNITASYWKNGVSVPMLGDATIPSDLYAIALNDADVYTAGSYSLSAAYWKNGTLNVLPGGTTIFHVATGIAVDNSDVYVSGYGNSPITNPVYWKNGTLIPLSGTNAVTTGIGIVQY